MVPLFGNHEEHLLIGYLIVYFDVVIHTLFVIFLFIKTKFIIFIFLSKGGSLRLSRSFIQCIWNVIWISSLIIYNPVIFWF